MTRVRFRCVLFDHDDTLLPTFALRRAALAIAAAEVLAAPIDAGAVLARSNGLSLDRLSTGLAGDDPALAARLVAAYRHHYADQQARGVAAFAGIAETLERLRDAGTRCGVVTSKLGAYARRELEASGLASYFPVVITAEDVSRHKPDAEPLQAAMRALDAAPEATLMVGDTSADILGARNAGVASAAALWGTQDPDALLAHAPDHVLDSPPEVAALVEGA